MEEDLDYYLAMEEDAQQEEEDWGEEGGMEIQQLPTAPNVHSTSTVNALGDATIVSAASSVPKVLPIRSVPVHAVLEK